MQIPKISLWLGVLTLGVALNVQAVDSPEQAAARATLEAKMKELDAQPPVVSAEDEAKAKAAEKPAPKKAAPKAKKVGSKK